MTRPTKPDGDSPHPDASARPFDAGELRRVAEGRAEFLPAPLPRSEGELRKLVHELHVHQIELEMQNEALAARLEVEESCALYTDLYELAPVAYFTLRPDGSIRQMNFAGATLIGLPPGRLKGQRLGAFVAQQSLPAFNEFLAQVFGNPGKKVCELTFERPGEVPVMAHVEAVADAGGAICRLGATDISELKRTEQALRESEERLRLALLASRDGWWDWKLEADELYLSPRWLAILGYAAGELEPRGGTLAELVHPEDRLRVRRTILEAIDGGAEHYELEFRARHKDGHYVPMHSQAHISRDADGRATRLSGTDADLTGRKRAAEERRLAQMVFASTDEGIMVTDAKGAIVEVNPAFEVITGYTREEVVGANSRMLRSVTHDEAFFQAMLHALESSGQWRGELWCRRRSGETCPLWLSVSAVRDPGDGRVTHYVCVFSDISTSKAAQQQIEFLAHHDALTGLPNRTLFRERLEHALIRAQRHRSRLAVMFLDLDRFKSVNDALGHPVGDTLLREIADRLNQVVRAEDTLARLGGDEFVLLVEDDPTVGNVTAVARKLIGALGEPMTVAGQELRVSVSIGASLYPQHGGDGDTLLKNADQAMYQAKKQGRNRFQLFTPQLSGGALERLVMENALRAAVGRSELLLHLQPQVALGGNRLAGVEALVRWHHPKLGLVLPARFIPLAEEIGVIGEIGQWVLFEACRQMARWRAEGIPIPSIAVNLSARQIDGAGLLGVVSAALEANGVPPAQLELEITESMLVERPEEARRVLAELRRLGVRTAVDDFGVGYSSLAYLKRLPLDRLKIDRSFVQDIGHDRGDEAIARAVIGLAVNLGLETVAEGVEHAAQAEFLQREGCGIGQGFHFGRPVPPDELVARLRERRLLPG